jgi:hypothetical protein
MHRGENGGEILSAAVRGLQFKERTHFMDLLVDFGMDPDLFATKALGLSGEIVVDPINIIPGFWLYGSLKLAGRTAMRARIIRDTLQAAGQTRVLQTLRRAFVSSTGDRMLDFLKSSAAGFSHAEQAEILTKYAQWEQKYQTVLPPDVFRKLPFYKDNPNKISNLRLRGPKGQMMRGADHKGIQMIVRQAIDDMKKLEDEIIDLAEVNNVQIPNMGDEFMHSLLRTSAKKEGERDKLRRAAARKLGTKTRAIRKDVRDIHMRVPRQIGKEFLEKATTTIPVKKRLSREAGDVVIDTERLNNQGVRMVMQKIDPALRRLRIALRERMHLPKLITKEDVVIPKMPKRMDAGFKRIKDELAREAEGKVSAHMAKDMGVKQILKNLQQVFKDYAKGTIDEAGLDKALSTFLGPGGIRIRHIGEIVALIKSRREALVRLTQFRDPTIDGVPEITRSILNGTYDWRELEEIVGTVGVETGLTAHIRNVGKRYDKLRDMMDGRTLEEIPHQVRNILESFISGDIDEAMALEIMGKPGEKTLRHALRRITRAMTAMDEIENVTRPRAMDRIEDLLERRYGTVIGNLEDMLEATPGYLPHVMSSRAIGAMLQEMDEGFLKQLHKDSVAQLIFRRYSQKLEPLNLDDLKKIVQYGPDALEAAGIPMFAPRTLMQILKDAPKEGAKMLGISPRAVIATRGIKVTQLLGKQSFLDETAKTFGVRLKGEPRPPSLRSQRLDEMQATERELRQMQIRDKSFLPEAELKDVASLTADIERREKHLTRLRGEIDKRSTLMVDKRLADLEAIPMREGLGPSPIVTPGEIPRATDVPIEVNSIPKGYMPSNNPDLDGWYFPAHLLPEIDRVTQNVFGGEMATNAVKRVYDTLQTYWKVWTLGVFPAYHMRNFWGNVWNMHLGGMFRPEDPASFKDSLASMVQAGQLQRWASTNNVDRLRNMTFILHNGDEITGVDLVRLAKRKGIINHGFFAIEPDQAFRGDPSDHFAKFPETRGDARRGLERATFRKGFRESPLGAEGAIAGQGVLFGRMVENNARLAMFTHLLKKGKTIEESVHLTKKYLFDYSDVTLFEKEWMRSAFPFYVWTRKNLPLQLEQAIKQPHIFSRIPKTTRAITEVGLSEEELPPREVIPKWILESSPVPVKRGNDGQLQFFLMRNWLPAMDVDEFITNDRRMRTAFSMLSPMITVPMETVMKKNLFCDSNLEGSQEFLGVRMDKRMANGLRVIRVLNTLDQLDPGGFFRKERRAAPASVRLASFFTGVKPPSVSPERELLSRVVRRRDQLQREFGRIKSRERRERMNR